MKKILLIIFLLVIIYCGVVYRINKEIERRASINRCVRVLVNEDEIENGCDEYFIHEKWYKEYMQEVYAEYNKIREGESYEKD